MANGMLGGFDPQEIQQMMAQFGATEKERQDANKQALFALGFGLLGGRKGSEFQTISRAGLGALDYRNRTLADIPQQKAQQFNAAAQMLSLQEQLRKRQEEAQLRQAIAGYKPPTQQGAAMAGMPSLAPTSQNAAELQARVAQQPQQQGVYERQLALADYLEGKGFIQQAEQTRTNAEKFAPQYEGMETVIGPDGKPTLLQKYKNRAPTPVAGGYQPKPELQILSLGNRQEAIDKLRIQPGQTWTPGMSPSDVAVDARARAAQAQAERHFQAGLGPKAQAQTAELRKEFNALPQVKAFGEVQPVLQSAREALGQDTAAADLNLIYAAAKIFDPTSVVRESETSLVMGTGSPAERFKGQWNHVTGGGRLTPETRKNLMQQVESRGRGFESGYKQARMAYEGVAKKQGIAPEDVFIEPIPSASPSAPETAPAVPKIGERRKGYIYKGGDPSLQSSWVKA